jgi:hypothetical protein
MAQREPTLVFSTVELDLLGHTADALTAYMGKPVLAEITDAAETGSESVLFAVPLAPTDSEQGRVLVQLGGAGARILGNKGGLSIKEGDVLSCEYLWAIQLSDLEGVSFIKLDQEGDEVAWTDELREILTFAVADPAPPDDADDADEADDADDAGDIEDAEDQDDDKGGGKPA